MPGELQGPWAIAMEKSLILKDTRSPKGQWLQDIQNARSSQNGYDISSHQNYMKKSTITICEHKLNKVIACFFLAWRCLIQIFFPDCYQHAYWETLLFFCLLSSHAGIAIHWWGMSPRELRSCCYVKPQSGLSPSLPGCAGLQMPCNWPSPPLLWRTALILASEPTLLQIDFKSD